MAKKCEECVKDDQIKFIMNEVDDLKRKVHGFNGDPGMSVNIGIIKDQLLRISARNKNSSGWVKATFVIFVGLLGVATVDHFDIINIKDNYVKKDWIDGYFNTLENKNILLEHMLLTNKYQEFMTDKIKLDSMNVILNRPNITRGAKKEKDWLKMDSIQ